MTPDPTRLIAALNRLFATLPLPNANADPREALRVYCEACSNYSADDVELAVKQFIEGMVKGVNMGFAPSAPQFVTQMRANLNYSAERRARENALLEQFREQREDEEFMAQRTPESRAKVKSILDAITTKEKTRTPEEIAAAKAALAKHDVFYANQFIESPTGVKVSTNLVNKLREAGYTTYNAADDDRHDMGGME